MAKEKLPKLAYTLEEAAGVCRQTMAEWVACSDFPAWKAGKRYIIPCDLFKNWLESKATARLGV